MRKPKSTFVHSKIAGRRFTRAERQYIRDLLQIEEFVVQPPTGFVSGMHFQGLCIMHPAEFDAIQAELRPAHFRARRREQARAAREWKRHDERYQRARLRREAKARALWESLGGLPG